MNPPLFGLFPDGQAVVVAMPPRFNIVEALRESDTLRLAMAFTHISGWKLLESGIRGSRGKVRLLTGIDFLQTEPQLLRKWLALCADSRFQARIAATKSGIFHPKVLIAQSTKPKRCFALVGSGNLSAGGLRTNVECTAYIDGIRHIDLLAGWFDQLFDKARSLREEDINEYARKYKRAQKNLTKIKKDQLALSKSISQRHEAFILRRNKAVEEAKRYFRTQQFKKTWEQRTKAAKLMKKLLHLPFLDFTRQEWKEFYGVLELGRLRPKYRDLLFRQEKRLKKSLRILVSDEIPESDRLSSVLNLDGRYSIPGLRMNTISKILAVHNPARWPVYNTPVTFTLHHFGYEPPRRAGLAGKYLAYANAMRGFMKDTGAPDVLALDSFFYHFARRRQLLKHGVGKKGPFSKSRTRGSRGTR